MALQISILRSMGCSPKMLGQLLLLPQKRSLHVCPCPCKNASFDVSRQARFIKKLMTGSSHSKKKFFTVDQPVSKTFAEMGTTVRGGGVSPVKSKKCLRRVEVLNALFMEQITSMMSTGEVSEELLGLGLVVSRVNVSSDFSRVNVYWVASGTYKDDVIEPILSKAGGKLRHELTQLRVIGIVPPIEFVKDKTHSKIAEVEYLLTKCDFGDDFVPTTSNNLFSQINPKYLRQQQDDPVVSSDDAASEVSAPVSAPVLESELYDSISMRQDVLGVRHDVIRNQISEMVKRINTKKAKLTTVPEQDLEEDPDAERLKLSPLSSPLRRTNEEIVAEKRRQQDFFKYLKKQQLAKTAQLKQLTTEANDKEFYYEEAFERWRKATFDIDNPFDDEKEDEDYAEETYYSGNNLHR